jgi:hypothetical protein
VERERERERERTRANAKRVKALTIHLHIDRQERADTHRHRENLKKKTYLSQKRAQRFEERFGHVLDHDVYRFTVRVLG